jgi:single-strand selective monofunctional uracil DNA glycosylase
MSLAAISRSLSRKVNGLTFSPPVSHVYNPLDYARAPHEAYLERWGQGPKQVLLLGMNPGPFGMAQTGVPFGDVRLVRDFLGVSAPVRRPSAEHPKRPVLGFDCPRSEVSGSRLWGFARDRFGSPERFFETFFVVNYCPLCFMDEGGRNVTPDKLPPSEREPLLAACDDALRKIVAELEPEWVIGVGAFAQKQAERALGGLPVRIGTVLHPSPASPLANRGWAEEAQKQLRALGIACG